MAARHFRRLTTRPSLPTHLLTTTTEPSRTLLVSVTPPVSAQPRPRTSQAKRYSTQPALLPDGLRHAEIGNARARMGATTTPTRTISLSAVTAAKPMPKLKKSVATAPRCLWIATRTMSSRRRHLHLHLRQARSRSRSGLVVFVSRMRARVKMELVMAESQEPRDQRTSSGPRLTRRRLTSL
jgi:hypothetical protein